MNIIKFSVVIPLYNKGREIAETIRSVLNQNYPHFELVIVDDGSTDHSVKVVNRFVDERIRLVRQPNGGVSTARNRGIEESENDYIVFLDGDDLWSPNFLQEIRKLIKRFPEVGLYATNYRFLTIGEDGRSVVKRKCANIRFSKMVKRRLESEGYVEHGEYFKVASKGDLPLNASGVCVPRRVLDHVGCFPVGETVGEDQDLWTRIALCYTLGFAEKCCVSCRIETGNDTSAEFIPREECPFSRRLKSRVDSGRVRGLHAQHLMSYRDAHLVQIASLNIRAGYLSDGWKLLKSVDVNKLVFRKLYWTMRLAFVFVTTGVYTPYSNRLGGCEKGELILGTRIDVDDQFYPEAGDLLDDSIHSSDIDQLPPIRKAG